MMARGSAFKGGMSERCSNYTMGTFRSYDRTQDHSMILSIRDTDGSVIGQTKQGAFPLPFSLCASLKAS